MTFQVKQFCRLTPSGLLLFDCLSDSLKSLNFDLSGDKSFSKVHLKIYKINYEILIIIWRITLFYCG